jgi:hypothetical protein
MGEGEENKNLKVIIENKWKNTNLRTFLLLGVIVVLILTNLTTCSGRRNDKKTYEQNQEAMKKELVVEKNKNDELQTSVVAYEGKVKDLEEYSVELAEDVKNLKNRKPEVIIRTEVEYRDTNIFITNNVVDTIGLDKDEYRLSWKYANNDSTRVIEGNSVFGAKFKNDVLNITPRYTNITLDRLSLDFTVGLVKNKKTGFEEIFVTPKNPNVTVGTLEGAILNRKKKVGLNLSVGLGYGVFYGANNNVFGHGPTLGIYFGKSLLSF